MFDFNVNLYRFYTSVKQVFEKINIIIISDGYQFMAEFSRLDCQSWKIGSSILPLSVYLNLRHFRFRQQKMG